jgi:hypothetical protein
MPKRRLNLDIRLPVYQADRVAWRKAIHTKAVEQRGLHPAVRPKKRDRFEVRIRLYLPNSGEGHDVDNRLKDILDALQGTWGHRKFAREANSILPNDRQIIKVVIEKSSPPKQARKSGGRLRVSKMSSPRIPKRPRRV